MDESIKSSIQDELDTILEETIQGHVTELERILDRPWTNEDFTRTLIGLSQLATDASSVEEAVNREVAHLGATGAVADQLADLLPDYFGMLMQVWLVLNSLIKTRRYNGAMEGVEEDDGERDVCCVCLERLHRGLVATLDCEHEFHRDCIWRWLVLGQDVCPLCKIDVLLL